MAKIARKEVYSPYDISRICQEPIANIYHWIYRKEIPNFEIPGGHLRVRHEALENFFKARQIPVSFDHDKPFEKFRVLIVDDDQDMIEIVAKLLEEDPRLEVRMETSGFSAGLHVSSWHPDLILLDFLMPGMSGFEVCRLLRENPESRDIPVVATTSLETPENRQAVMEAGVSYFLGKPFQSEVLMQKVRQMLGISAEIRVTPF